jgi:DNA-binding transcriptional LysR family regulator
LLVRTTRSLHLTDAGAAYYARCSRVVTELDEAERAVRDQRATPRGTLRITAPVDFALLYLWEVVAEYTQKYPDVSVMLSLTSRYVDLVGEGFDIALRAGPLADSSLVTRKLADSSLGLFATPGYLKKRGTPRTLAELADHTCVIFGREPRAVWKLRGHGKAHEVTVHGHVCVDEFGFVLRSVLSGAGIGLVPVFLTVEEVRKKHLVRLFDDYGVDTGGMHLVYPSSRHLSAAARAFIDFTAKRLSFLAK